MKKISSSNLKEIFEREIKFLVDGIQNISNPYHFFCLSTVKGTAVSSRTVVLRNIEANPKLTQRQIAKDLGMSLGKTNYLIQVEMQILQRL